MTHLVLLITYLLMLFLVLLLITSYYFLFGLIRKRGDDVSVQVLLSAGSLGGHLGRRHGRRRLQRGGDAAAGRLPAACH